MKKKPATNSNVSENSTSEKPLATYKTPLVIATIIAIIAIFLLLRPFATAIIAAAITAYIFSPIYQWYYKKLNKRGTAASLTLITCILAIVIPVIIIAYVATGQIRELIEQIDKIISSNEILFSDAGIVEWVNSWLGPLTNDAVTLSVEQLQTGFLNVIEAISLFLLNVLTGAAKSIPSFITNSIIFVYIFLAILTNKENLVKKFELLNPLGEKSSKQYLERAGGMTTAMVRGQFIVAIAQGFAGAMFLSLAGLHYFVPFAVLMSLLSIIPLGGGIISIPIGIFMLLSGNIFGGLLVLLSHFLIITNIDNVLRPMLVPKQMRLHPALLMTAVLSGVVLFGFLGIVIGPVILALALTTIEIYIDYKQTK